jgi:tetrahydromethanopterin S-methyltransferase subunit A
MKNALDQAGGAFESSEEPEIRSLMPRISDYQSRMEPLAYDCIGCKKCWGADATIELANHFDQVELDTCGSGDEHASGDIKSAVAPSNRYAHSPAIAAWPPHPGDYVLGNPEGTVAICTLSNRDLPVRLIAAGEPAVAIAGRCDTENIGVEKVVLNLLANPRIRWLVICGTEAKGHRAGDAFLRLKERGVDADMRVLESASWRPILKNLTLLDVAQFRQQIEEVNLVGVTDIEGILAAVRDCVHRPVQAFPAVSAAVAGRKDALAAIEHIPAKAPKQLRLDRAGFFIVLPQPQKRLIVCEHYENTGRCYSRGARICDTARPRRLSRSRTGQGRGGAFRWRHLRAGCRPRPTRSGGAAQNEKVRLPMQLDRELTSGDETPSKTQAGNEDDHKKQMARRTFGRSNHSSRRRA